jgi:hypothetical protein
MIYNPEAGAISLMHPYSTGLLFSLTPLMLDAVNRDEAAESQQRSL